MQDISLSIREVHQTSALDHVVIFDAEIQLLPESYGVDLALVRGHVQVHPSIYETGLIEQALDQIRAGMRSVLQARGFGAYALISGLYVDSIYWLPGMFERYTRLYLEQALEKVLPEVDSAV